MGVEYDVYVGAYLYITAPKVAGQGRKVCPNGHSHSGGIFCPECSEKLVVEETERYPFLWDLLDDEDNESLHQLNAAYVTEVEPFIIATSNWVSEDKYLTHFDTYQDFCVEITADDVDGMKIEMARLHYDTIEEMRRNGATVEVRFGAVGYYS